MNYADLELDPEGIFYWKEEPFTGTAIELFPDGQLYREVEMFEGSANGYWCKHFRYDQRKLEGWIEQHYTWTRDRYQFSSASQSERFRIEETIWDDAGKIMSKEARSTVSIPEERVNYEDLEMGADGLLYWKAKPFTGFGFEIHPNGQLATEHEILEGKVNGLTREWFPSGERKLEGYVSLSGHYGWVREWFPNSGLKRESISGGGVCIQETIWDEDGEVVSTYEHPRQVTSSGH